MGPTPDSNQLVIALCSTWNMAARFTTHFRAAPTVCRDQISLEQEFQEKVHIAALARDMISQRCHWQKDWRTLMLMRENEPTVATVRGLFAKVRIIVATRVAGIKNTSKNNDILA